MQRYIGIDVHASSCTVAVLGQSGKRIKELRIDTDQKVIKETLRGMAGDRYVCFEEGTMSDWLYELIDPLATEVMVVQLGKTVGMKSDSVDAWKLAEVPWRGAQNCRIVYKQPRQFTMLRKAVRTYEVTRTNMVRAKVQLNVCFRARNIRGFGSAIYDLEKREKWMAQLPPPSRKMAEILARQVDDLVQVHEAADQWLREEAKKLPLIRQLSTAPGIGTIRAAQIVATVISPHRFRTRRQFWAYCGFGIVTRSSADWRQTSAGWERQKTVKTRGLNRNCNPVMKSVFKGAAQTLVNMPGHPLNDAYRRSLESGIKPTLARLTLARRIAAVVLSMWKNNQEYDPDKHASINP